MSVFLDYAATSAVRPPSVAAAVAGYLTGCGATPGRGGYARAVEAGRVALAARRSVQRVLGVGGDPGRVAFMHNATHALNTALWGVLSPGDAVVVTAYDHNAVIRPVSALASQRGVEVRMAAGTPEGEVDYEEVGRLLEGARLLVVNCASNVLGCRLPVEDLASMARAAGTTVLLDAAQGAGHMPLDCEAWGVDMVAFTGHKGLLGPQGTGGLWVGAGLEVRPLLTGGTGGDSTRREMPEPMPDRLEAGTVNAPGLAGLAEGIRFLEARGVDAIHAHEASLKARLRDGLARIPGVTVLSPAAPDGVGIVTFVARDVDPSTLVRRLDAEWGVEGRAGLHCAPDAHRILGTTGQGAVRLSLGWASTEADVDRALEGVEAVTGAPARGAGGAAGRKA